MPSPRHGDRRLNAHHLNQLRPWAIPLVALAEFLRRAL
jgi:hypothetical protein